MSNETTGLNAISEEVSGHPWNADQCIQRTSTNRTIDNLPGCEFIEVRDGKIHKIVGYYDRLSSLTQLGVVITPPAPVSA